MTQRTVQHVVAKTWMQTPCHSTGLRNSSDHAKQDQRHIDDDDDDDCDDEVDHYNTKSNLWKLKYICWSASNFLPNKKRSANVATIMYSDKCYWIYFTSVTESWLRTCIPINNDACLYNWPRKQNSWIILVPIWQHFSFK